MATGVLATRPALGPNGIDVLDDDTDRLEAILARIPQGSSGIVPIAEVQRAY